MGENAKYNRKKDGRLFDLFIRRDVSNEAPDRILTIKFVSDKCKLGNITKLITLRHLNYVGFTMNAKINKNDTLADVIDFHLGKYNRAKYLASCFRVKMGDKLIHIPSNSYSQCRPYYEFMRDNNGDFLIFAVKKCPLQGVHLRQYC